ncbi:MAG: Phosphotransferase system sorbitol-specific component [Firmicutes bacterium]|nr:Phosphotransferase system sorbitol-specific component [Bacillota bacterium]
MSVIFNTEVVKLGEMASAFIAEKMVILFQENAPAELAEYCVLHTGHQLVDTVQAGDILVFAGIEYKIVYVGEQVQKNLRDLGHITLKFNNNCEAENLEGSLYLEDKEVTPIHIGDEISIIRK